ncbi:hypothetical protein PGB90_007429 [Kerria lacca]
MKIKRTNDGINMQQDKDFSTLLYESICLSQKIRQLETTARVIASEVAIGENAYYGSIKPIGDDSSKKIRKYVNDSIKKNESRISLNSKISTSDSVSKVNEKRVGDESPTMFWSSSPLPPPRTPLANTDSNLQLQMFINSISDTLSYASVDTTIARNAHCNENAFPQGSSATYVSPMGSTTQLITSDTSSNFRFQFCETKCFPIFGTFFMTISLTASLGNILRLPTTVFQHGGGTFLLAYIVIVILIGIPLTFLEIILGQFCQQGTTKLWRAVPVFKGIGVTKLLSCVLLCLYYPIIIVNAAFYLIWSLYKPLPTSQCFSILLPKFINPDESTGYNGETIQKLCSTNETLGYGFDNDIVWLGIKFTLLGIVWIFIMLCVFKNGISFRMSCTVLVPLAIFIIVTLFIEGIRRNTEGINYLINIKWESLFSIEIWYTALIQFFFSSHVGLGNITTCAGRLYPKSNPFWTAISYVFVNTLVGIIFVCIFYMWYSELISTNNITNTSEVQELFILTIIYDVVSKCYGRYARIWAFMSYTIIIMAGIISMQNFFIIRLLDHYVLGKLIITTTILEVFAFVWFYGLKSLSNDFEFILGYKLNIAWKTSWFLIPITLLITAAYSWCTAADNTNISLSEKMDLIWFHIVSWLIYLLAWIAIIIIGIWKVFSQVDYNFSQKFISSTKPTRNWGPVDPIYRHCWIQWKKQYQATGEKDFTLRRRGTRDYTHSVKRGRHAGPIGMQYSVKPISNQNTLERKMNTDDHQLRYSYANSTISDHHTYCNNDYPSFSKS